MDIDDVFGDGEIGLLIAFVQHDEEQIESGHDGSGHVQIGLQRLRFVVSPADGVGRSEY